jgi:hypothetical protein
MKIGEPEEVAGLVSFIVSEQGRLLLGSIIDRDGGSIE